MAARQVTFDSRGFTFAEMMTVVAIAGILAALSVSAYSESQKIGRVNAQARLLVQRLQNVRTQAVSQGAAQGYHIGINGLHVAGVDANQAFIFYKTNPLTVVVTYDSVNDRKDRQIDWLPTYGDSSMVIVQGANGAQAAPLDIGFDINGMPTVNPAPAGPSPGWYCIRIRDTVTPSIDRRVILFDDGTVKVQRNETYCP
jgi:prepilin-type N-terminal cleavage/methylation domain-containing protein